ncbi:MAG: type VI secretion system baseplate subunit TssG, partial [Spirochaetaceae bacterium]|nr:type VI secretion system baseplate subunit TssG [Spirochaetaceae bacterium]
TSLYDIPPRKRAVLGSLKTSVLGKNLQIGRSMLSITGQFEIQIGPVTFDEYSEFMMGHSGFDLLTQAVNQYLDRPLAYTIVFIIKVYTIPLAQLGFDLEKGSYEATRLGYNAWIGFPEGSETRLQIEASRIAREKHKESQTENF